MRASASLARVLLALAFVGFSAKAAPQVTAEPLDGLGAASAARAEGPEELGVELLSPTGGQLERGVLELEVGEPFELRLTLVHALGEAPRFDPELALDAEPYLLDAGWLLIEAGAFRPQLGSASPDGLERSVAKLQLARIETEPELARDRDAELEGDGAKGAVTVPVPRVVLGERELGGVVYVADCAVQVSSLIADGALTPLPPRGLAALDGWRAEPRWTRAWIIAGLAFAAFLAAMWMTLRGGAAGLGKADAIEPPLERIGRGRLSVERGAVGEELRAVAFDVSTTVRATFDHVVGQRAAGATDAEWLAALRLAGLDAELARRIERLFQRTEKVRFGGQLPTAWGTTELLDEAERLVDRAPRAFEPASVLEVAS